jgi:hypothetical protein
MEHFEWLAARIYDLLLKPPHGQAQLADHLDEVTGQLGAELATRRWADAELEALRTSAARVWDMMLDNVDRPFFLVASMSMAVELLEGRINAAAANEVRWGPVLPWLSSCHISQS